MTNQDGRLTPAQVKAMGPSEMADFLRRNSGDPNFPWQVREAILNRAAELLQQRADDPTREHPSTDPATAYTNALSKAPIGCGCLFGAAGEHYPSCAHHPDHPNHPRSLLNRTAPHE